MNKLAPQDSMVKMYQAREKIYPRDVKGRYASLRWACVWVTQLVFYGLPWLSWNGHQAVLFDLAARKFYIFGIVLWPQDFIWLTILLIICAYSLFLFTAMAGRVWCGFACPQTIYTEVFLWIERRIEGARSARIRLDKQPWTTGKIARKTAKHIVWAVVALWTGFTLVAYFTPTPILSQEALALSLGPWEMFWLSFYALATYGNAGWMREQVCRYMCPYARFQSAMFDKDTLIITYDQLRGEPRGARSGKSRAADESLGECIDCSMCVQVCPMGVDIRRGLLYECIGCASCIDACNEVLKKINAPLGLIRYSTEHAMTNNLTQEQIQRRVLRPRVLIYIGILWLVVGAFFVTLFLRTPLKLDVIRDRGAMAREVEYGRIENVYRLQIMNTAEKAHRYRIAVSGIDSIKLASNDEVDMEGATSRTMPVRVQVDAGKGNAGSNKIEFALQALDDKNLKVQEKATFFVPK